jgi:hypothetical protein
VKAGAIVCALLGLAFATNACAASSKPAPEATVNTDCTLTLKPGTATELRDAIAAAADGAILCIEPSTITGTLGFSKSVTLRGVGDSPGAVVFDGDGMGPVLHVREDGITVSLENVTLQGGAYDSGGALALKSSSKVNLSTCVVKDNEADENGGGAFYVSSGSLSLSDCDVSGNTGEIGGAILVTTDGSVSISGGRITANTGVKGGAIALRHGGTVTLAGVAVTDNEAEGHGGAAIYLRGSGKGTPSLTIAGGTVTGGAEPIVDDGGKSKVVRTP